MQSRSLQRPDIDVQDRKHQQSAISTSLLPSAPLDSWLASTLRLQELKMELAISAVTGELVSRFVSYLADKYRSSRRPQSGEKQLRRLQQLLLRARTVVEEADGRYITNSGMLAQLTMLADAMYRGYWALGAFGYMSREETETTPMEEEGEVSSSSPRKRLRTVHASARKNKAMYLADLQGVVESLEDVVTGLTECVVLLGGCDCMLHRPYDAYLYNDSIMFGRHTEKQKLLNFMLQHSSSSPGGTPAVLPIIGAPAVGKRTLVAHVCKDERVSSHFSSILHLNGDSFRRDGEPCADLGGMVGQQSHIVSSLEKVLVASRSYHRTPSGHQSGADFPRILPYWRQRK